MAYSIVFLKVPAWLLLCLGSIVLHLLVCIQIRKDMTSVGGVITPDMNHITGFDLYTFIPHDVAKQAYFLFQYLKVDQALSRPSAFQFSSVRCPLSLSLASKSCAFTWSPWPCVIWRSAVLFQSYFATLGWQSCVSLARTNPKTLTLMVNVDHRFAAGHRLRAISKIAASYCLAWRWTGHWPDLKR